MGTVRNLYQRIKTSEQEKFLSVVLLFMAMAIGTAVRWNFISGSSYPVNDGGFFYQLILDLQSNNYRLPLVTSYNQAGIPFAYPPFGFYLVGVIQELTGLSVITLLNYLPLIINILCIPICFAVAGIFYKEDYFSRALATYIYATLPRSFEWLVMGGGITRVTGYFFALLAILFSAKLHQGDKCLQNILITSGFSCLTILSHPVAALFLAFSLIVFFFFYRPHKFQYLFIIGALAIALSAPWWGAVLSNHGLSPYLGATNTGHVNWFEMKYLLTLNFEYENRFFLSLISLLAILGLFSEQRKNATYLGILVFLGYLIIPRGGVDLLAIYVAILATLGFSVIVNRWQASHVLSQTKSEDEFFLARKTRIFLFGIIIYTFLGAFTYKYVDGKLDLRLTENEYQAMIWVSENTQVGAEILHLPAAGSSRNWPNDYIGEWLPALTDRKSLATVQGYEWIPEEFQQRIYNYLALRNCSIQGMECLTDWSAETGFEADYIFLAKSEHSSLLIDNFRNSSDYSPAFENDGVIILRSNK